MRQCTIAAFIAAGFMIFVSHNGTKARQAQQEAKATAATKELRVAVSCAFYSEDRVYEYRGLDFQLLAFPTITIKSGTKFVLRSPKLSDVPRGEAMMAYFAGTPTWTTGFRGNPEQVDFLANLLQQSWELPETAAGFAGPTALVSCTPIDLRTLRFS